MFCTVIRPAIVTVIVVEDDTTALLERVEPIIYRACSYVWIETPVILSEVVRRLLPFIACLRYGAAVARGR